MGCASSKPASPQKVGATSLSRGVLLCKASPSSPDTPDGAQAKPTAAHKDEGLHAASAVTLAVSSSEPTAGTVGLHVDAPGQQPQVVGRPADGSPDTAAVLAEPEVSASNSSAVPQVSATPAQQSGRASDGSREPQQQSQERRHGIADAPSAAESDAIASGAGAAVTKHKYVDVITGGEQMRARCKHPEQGQSRPRGCTRRLGPSQH